METKTHLLDAFPPSSKEQWVQQIIKDLKGGDFNTLLKYRTRDGIEVGPVYAVEDTQKYAHLGPLFAHTDWDICEAIQVTEEAAANQQALHALNNGATALIFHVTDAINVTTLLHEIGLAYIGVQFVVSGDMDVFDQSLSDYLAVQQLERSSLNLAVYTDPIAYAVQHGNWPEVLATVKIGFIRHTLRAQFMRTICVDGTIYHNAGAPPAYELACMLAHANEYLQWMGEDSLKNNAPATLQVNVAIGPDYFFEIAKLRALRKVFTLLFDSYGLKTGLYIHAVTATRNLTLYDASNNLLRTTTEAMAATIGGCNSLLVQPFDVIYKAPNEFSGRLARNIQLILKAESYFDQIADAAAGSYFIEELTEQLANKAWQYFREMEQAGGFIACLEQGSIQQQIAGFAAEQQQGFDEGKEVLVGANKFPDLQQRMRGKTDLIMTPSSESPATTLFPPLVATRLAAKSEQERWMNEPSTAA